MARAHLMVLLAGVLACQASEFGKMSDFITTLQEKYDDVYPVIPGELSPLVPCDGCREKRSVGVGNPYTKWISQRIKSNAMARNRCPDEMIRYFRVCVPVRKLLAHRDRASPLQIRNNPQA